ncbi:MAG: SpoIID/LytB domain-containing protein [Fusobacteriaceae bacterium]|nr:SpoIID/LytB domain-containing protein [Fusobacteriaceae bacterium]
MKIVNKMNILMTILLVIFMVSCGTTDSNRSRPTPIPSTGTISTKTSPADYDLDYSYFKDNNLPIPNFFRGNSQEYLVPIKDVLDGYDFFDKYDEAKALQFYKDTTVRGVGDNSFYWRWKVTFTDAEFNSTVTNGLLFLSKNRSRDIYMLSGKNWVNKSFSRNDIGEIKDVEIAARGKSGIVTYIVITTNTNTFLLLREISVRRLFAPNKSSANTSRDINIYGAKGGQGKYSDSPFRTNVSILPSGYCAIEKNNGNVTIYGGGNGHGVGMSQYAAFDLTANNNYTYKDVLHRYYPNTKLVNMYKLEGVTKNIRVGISNSGGGLSHNAVNLSSTGKITIVGNGFKIDVPVNTNVNAKIVSGKLNIAVGGKHRVATANPVTITTSGKFIVLNDVKKSHTRNPSYRGKIELKASGSAVRVINELYIEDYLKQVLPSEMPKTFGVEALKAQAVAARTYALSDFLKYRYKNEGFHVKDTVESQVYNNQLENDESDQAIDDTIGEVLINNEKPADAKYFSTSSGFIEAANYVW